MPEARIDRIRRISERVKAQKERLLERVRIASQREGKFHGIWMGLHNPPGPGHGQGGDHRPHDEDDLLDRVRKANHELSERRKRR